MRTESQRATALVGPDADQWQIDEWLDTGVGSDAVAASIRALVGSSKSVEAAQALAQALALPR